MKPNKVNINEIRERMASRHFNSSHREPPSKYSFVCGFDAASAVWEQRVQMAIRYCEPHVDQMWAASVVGELLGCDFKDAKEMAKQFLGDK